MSSVAAPVAVKRRSPEPAYEESEGSDSEDDYAVVGGGGGSGVGFSAFQNESFAAKYAGVSSGGMDNGPSRGWEANIPNARPCVFFFLILKCFFFFFISLAIIPPFILLVGVLHASS